MKLLSESLPIQDAFEAVKYGKKDIISIVASFAVAMSVGYLAERAESENRPTVSSTQTFLNPTNKAGAMPTEPIEGVGEVLGSTFSEGKQIVTLSVGDASTTIVYACAPDGGLTRSRTAPSAPTTGLLMPDNRIVTNRYYCEDNVLTEKDGFLPSGSKIAYPHP